MLAVDEHELVAGGGGVGKGGPHAAQGCGVCPGPQVGSVGGSWIWLGLRLDACNTVVTTVSTVVTGGMASEHVAHVDQAAVMAPCCAACWMVE